MFKSFEIIHDIVFSFLLLGSGCRSVKGWDSKDSYIASGIGHSDDAELLLLIKVDRFTQKKSQFSMDFEIEFCTGMNCRLKIQLVSICIMCNYFFKDNNKQEWFIKVILLRLLITLRKLHSSYVWVYFWLAIIVYVAMVSRLRFRWIKNSSDHRRVLTASVSHAIYLPNILGVWRRLGNCSVCKTFVLQTLLWSPEFVIHQNLEHGTSQFQTWLDIEVF